MKRVALVAVGLVAGLTLPVFASHVTEPTAPLTDVELSLSNYGTATPIACGSTVDFNNLRIEVFYTVADKPSEHWRARLVLESRANPGANWYVDWQHANNPPHSKTPWNGTQASQRLIPDADYTVTLRVTGDESGVQFVESCTFHTSP